MNAKKRCRRQSAMRHARFIADAFEACANNDSIALDELLYHRRAPSSASDAKGNTLLHVACASDALDAAKVCVKYAVFAHHPPERAYVRALNANGERAIDVARTCGSVRCERWLEALEATPRAPPAPAPSSRSSSSSSRALSDGATLLLKSLLSALMVDDVAEDEDARTRAVLTQVSALVADREALRKDLLRAKEALASARARAESERAEERDAVCAALQLAEQRARALCVERDNAVAEKSAIEAEALRHKASAVDGDASASASRRAYDDGYAAGWEAALRLPSREYVRAQLKLEKGASATAPTTPTDEFSEITLRDDGGEDASARKENGKTVALADVSLASRASTVLRESFVAVKHRVTELERALSTGKNAASTRTES